MKGYQDVGLRSVPLFPESLPWPLKAHMVRTEDLPPVETMRDEAADCLRRHLVTVTAEEDARRREFEARLAKATGRT